MFDVDHCWKKAKKNQISSEACSWTKYSQQTRDVELMLVKHWATLLRRRPSIKPALYRSSEAYNQENKTEDSRPFWHTSNTSRWRLHLRNFVIWNMRRQQAMLPSSYNSCIKHEDCIDRNYMIYKKAGPDSSFVSTMGGYCHRACA